MSARHVCPLLHMRSTARCLFAQVVGWGLDVCTLELFDATLEQRIGQSTDAFLGPSLVIHWLFGALFLSKIDSVFMLLQQLLWNPLMRDGIRALRRRIPGAPGAPPGAAPGGARRVPRYAAQPPWWVGARWPTMRGRGQRRADLELLHQFIGPANHPAVPPVPRVPPIVAPRDAPPGPIAPLAPLVVPVVPVVPPLVPRLQGGHVGGNDRDGGEVKEAGGGGGVGGAGGVLAGEERGADHGDMFGLENLFRQVLEITEEGEGEEEEGEVGAVMLLDAEVEAGGGPPIAAPAQPPMPPPVAPPQNVFGMPVAVNAPAQHAQWRAEEAGDDLLDNLLADNVLADIIDTPYVSSV